MARLPWLALPLALCAGLASGQQQKPTEPAEEDESLIPKEYSFNPLQAEKELKVGAFYFKKGSYRAAARRFQEATKWNPGSAEAYLRLGEAEEKLKDRAAARAAYGKFLELAPSHKRASEIKRRLSRLEPDASKRPATPPGSGGNLSPSWGTSPRTGFPG